jgi:CHAD domain-containing protein
MASHAISSSFSVKPKESFQKGISRIVRRQLKRAAALLRNSDELQGEAVHDVRKRIKRTRAVLRLIREELGSRAYHRQNAALRGAGRSLSDVRNSKVMLDALAKLEEREGQRITRGLFDAMASSLKSNLEETQAALKQDSAALKSLRRVIRKVRRRVDDWNLPKRGAKCVRCGLTRAHDLVVSAFEAAEGERSVEKLHELRKRTQYFYHQLQLFQQIDTVRELAERWHAFAQYLGDDHDLAMLRSEAGACDRPECQEGRPELIALIDEHRRELERKAFEAGHSLIADELNEPIKQIAKWLRHERARDHAVAIT